MAEYLHPGVYVERRPAAAQPIEAVGTSTGAFVGIAQRGEVGRAYLVTSWEQYKARFAFGMDSPFYADSYLGYSVFGFFANGGSRCWIVRAATSSASRASVDLLSFTEQAYVTVTALDEGAWGDRLSVSVADGEAEDSFSLIVKLDGAVVETFESFTLDVPSADTFLESLVNGVSRYVSVKVTDGTQTPDTEQSFDLTGGNNGESGIAVTDFETALSALDNAEINMLAIPGTNATVANADSLVKTYVEGRGDCVGLIDPISAAQTPEDVLTYRASLGSDDLLLYYPWVEVADPLSRGSIKAIPPSGHVMGLFARTDGQRGVWKAPAGVEASILGITGISYEASDAEQGLLNPKGINVLRSLPNIGIVSWGARTLSAKAENRYVPVVRTMKMIDKSLYNGTLFAVHEPNNENLWLRMRTSARAFLLSLFRDGAFKGTSPDEAFLVKCDGEINDEIAQDEGKVYMEVGVALVKPSEFVIIRVGQKQMGS